MPWDKEGCSFWTSKSFRVSTVQLYHLSLYCRHRNQLHSKKLLSRVNVPSVPASWVQDCRLHWVNKRTWFRIEEAHVGGCFLEGMRGAEKETRQVDENGLHSEWLQMTLTVSSTHLHTRLCMAHLQTNTAISLNRFRSIEISVTVPPFPKAKAASWSIHSKFSMPHF